MTIDFAILSIIAIFALIGAATGAARQVANLAASVVAWFSARPLGVWAGPKLAPSLNQGEAIGIVAATVVAFIVVAVLVRWILTRALQRILAGRNPESRSLDRILGFLFAGAKVALVAWVMLCALTFVEENVSVAGRRLGVSPKDSRAFALARTWNLFEFTQFAPVRDLQRVVKASRSPKQAEALKNDPLYKELAKDPRFRRALEEKRLRTAFAEGDYPTLVKSSAVMELVRDPKIAELLERVAGKIE
ncbi:MAG: CvpA family protein [Myxococcaceae bacterium]